MSLVDYSSSGEEEDDEPSLAAGIETSKLPMLPPDFHDLYSGISIVRGEIA